MSETNTLEEFKTKFFVDALTVKRNDAWTWSVRPNQPTLGSGIISLNRYAPCLSEVTPDEMAELGKLITIVEGAVRTAFDYSIMNYLMLMMVDHHVHYHVIPRYDASRQFSGLEWADNGWPALPVMSDSQYKNQENVLQSIQDVLISSSVK